MPVFIKFKGYQVTMLCALLGIYIYCFMYRSGFVFANFVLVKKMIVYYLAFYLLPKVFCFFERKLVFFLCPIVSLAVLNYLSLGWNSQIYNLSFAKNMSKLDFTFLVEMFCVIAYIAMRKETQFVKKSLLYFLILLTLANDLLVWGNLIPPDVNGAYVGLVGSKFNVCYLHMFLLMAIGWNVLQDKKNKIQFYRFSAFWIVYSVLIAKKVDCNTGMIGSALLFGIIVLLLEMEKVQSVAYQAKFLFLAIVVITMIVFVLGGILNLPFVYDLIVNKLHRDISLTGRMDIYGEYLYVLKDYWMWGVGYGNSSEACMELFGYANTQNGFLEWILQIGIINTGVLLFLFVIIFSKLKLVKENSELTSIIAVIYVFTILASVEITISVAYIFLFALIGGVYLEKAEGLYEN